MYRAYRFRFYPTQDQETLLRKTLGCCRVVYNHFLDYRTKEWHQNKNSVGYNQTSALLTELKKTTEYEWLNEVSCVPLQQSLQHLQTGFKNFFQKKNKYPSFKKRKNRNSCELTKSAFKYKEGKIYIAKSKEPLNIRWSRQIPSHPSTITITLEPSGRWMISMLCEEEIKQLKPTDKVIGLDLGIDCFFATSNGDKITNPKWMRKVQNRLKILSQRLSKKQKGSKNREKARVKVAKLHQKIRDTRLDFQHKISTQLVRENQTIVVEDLNVSGMLKNHKLARAIAEVSWGQFVSLLKYKCEWYGRTLLKVDRYFPSSKTCNSCGSIQSKMPLNVRKWTCPDCGAIHDRDINAAKNILAVGNTVYACGGNVRPKEVSSGGSSVEAGNLNREVK